MRHLSLAHAECVMREVWVRLGQILDFAGVLMWLWASVLQWNTLQFFCWTTGWPAGPTPQSRVICHRAATNVFRGKDVPFIFLLTWRMRRRTEDILEEGIFLLDVGWSCIERVEGELHRRWRCYSRGELLKGQSLEAKNKASERGKGLISRNRKAERREKKIKQTSVRCGITGKQGEGGKEGTTTVIIWNL